MIFKGNECNNLVTNPINQSMLIGNPTRKITFQAVFKGLRLSSPFKRSSPDFFNQFSDFEKYFFVFGSPFDKLFKCFWLKQNVS